LQGVAFHDGRVEKRFRQAGLVWPLSEGMDDEALERVLRCGQPLGPTRPLREIAYIVQELKRPHVTMQLLWMEYMEACPNACGDTLSFVEPRTGQIVPVNIFVAALGASSCAYAEAILGMTEPNWIASHTRAFEFFG